MKPGSLRRRLAVAFAALTLFLGVCGAALSFLLIYSVEDEVFNRLVEDEAQRVGEALDAGREPQARLPFVELLEREQLPPPVQAALRDNERRREASGDGGRHFHFRPVARAELDAPPLYVLAQVDDYLVVRPMRLDVINFLGALSLVLTVLAAAFGVWLAYRYTRPLHQLTALVSEADPAGLPADFAERFDDTQTRRLATTLEHNYERIAAFVERERRFTREASHELRTPLAVMHNALELLRTQPLTDQQTVWLDRMAHSMNAMQQSVEALLMLAREEFTSAAREPVRVLPLVERAVVNHAAQLSERPVTVKIDLPTNWTVQGHEGALQIIVANLIGNAFQHCPEGEIRVERSGNTLTVRNPVAEFPADLAARATEPEVKGAQSEGMGLGLAIVERLCRRLEWRFVFRYGSDDSVEASVDFGDGSTLTRGSP